MNEAPVKKCQVCESPVEKLVSASSFQLKGSGWYVTDYKNPASTAPSKTHDNGLKNNKTDVSESRPNKKEPKSEGVAKSSGKTAEKAAAGKKAEK